MYCERRNRKEKRQAREKTAGIDIPAAWQERKKNLKIYIIRHGETELNALAILQGWLDAPLNEYGRFLSAETGRALKGVHFDECISSPLKRARETAEILLRESGNEDTPFTFDERIKEISFGTSDGKKMDESDLPPEEARLFFTDPFNFPGYPEGETIAQLCERTQNFMRELIARDDGKTYLLATHGCALRAMLNPLYEDPSDFWHQHVPYNCVINIIEAENGKAKLVGDDKIYYDRKYCVDRYVKSPQPADGEDA